MKIAFSGKARSGKDTCADYVKRKLDGKVKVFAFAEYPKIILSDAQNVIKKPLEKVPLLLQIFAESLKSYYGGDLFANLVRDVLLEQPSKTHLIISDLRCVEEYDMLKKLGFVLIRVNRTNRPIDRDPTHISECALDNHSFDFTIQNDNDIQHLKKELDKILLSI